MQRKKQRSFRELPKSRRAEEGFRLRREIARTRDLYGGRFTSDMLPESKTGRRDEQWFDFLFVGRHKYEIYNASIITAHMAFWEEIESRASERMRWRLSRDRRERMSSDGHHEDALIPLQYYRSNGLTINEHTRQFERDILKHDPPEIYESFRLDHSFRYGTGLDIIVDADFLTIDTINQSLDRFLLLGQKNWQSAAPISRERLPSETRWDYQKKSLRDRQ